MKKNAVLYILLVFLLVANGFFMLTLLRKQDNRPPEGQRNPFDFVAKELRFDADQMQRMEQLNKEHRHSMRAIDEALRSLKDGLFDNLSKPEVQAHTIDSITDLIGNKEKAKDMETFYHFRAIRDLCNETQKQRFIRIVQEALRQGGPKGNRPPPPPRP